MDQNATSQWVEISLKHIPPPKKNKFKTKSHTNIKTMNRVEIYIV